MIIVNQGILLASCVDVLTIRPNLGSNFTETLSQRFVFPKNRSIQPAVLSMKLQITKGKTVPSGPINILGLLEFTVFPDVLILDVPDLANIKISGTLLDEIQMDSCFWQVSFRKMLGILTDRWPIIQCQWSIYHSSPNNYSIVVIFSKNSTIVANYQITTRPNNPICYPPIKYTNSKSPHQESIVCVQ